MLMDLQTQKLNLIEEVLHIENSALLSQLSHFVELLKHQLPEDDLPVMPFRSAEEIKARYEQSLRELESGATYSQEEVVAMTQKWRNRESA